MKNNGKNLQKTNTRLQNQTGKTKSQSSGIQRNSQDLLTPSLFTYE